MRVGRRIGAGLVVATLAVTACSSGDDAAAPRPTRTVPRGGLAPTTTTTPRQAPDGRLTIGLLLPTTGTHAATGQLLDDAARQAIDAINAAGGVAGQPVAVVAVDEGDTDDEAMSAVSELIEAGVDAVVGPNSSNVALSVVPSLTAAGIATCSPTATALALDDLPNRSLFLRTAPSDSLQAAGLALLVEQTGRTSVSIVWFDDVYGRPFAAAVRANVTARPTLSIASETPFSADSDMTQIARQALNDDPGAIVVLADAETGAPLLQALDGMIASDPTAVQPDVILNDAMRVPQNPQLIAGLTPAFRARLMGLSPSAGGTPNEPMGAYATNAVDCINLLALAAVVAGPNDHVGIADAVNDVSAGGGTCRDFATCAGLLASSLQIDYEGAVGPVQIGVDGDPDRARFDVFSYGDDGIDRTDRQLVASR